MSLIKRYWILQNSRVTAFAVSVLLRKNQQGVKITRYSLKLLDHAKQTATDALKLASKRAFHKTKQATGDAIGHTIADEITNVSKTSPQNNLETITNEEEMPRKRYISPEERQKITTDLTIHSNHLTI